MHIRLIRPVAVVAALALTLSAGLAPMTASAQQQVFGQWSTQNNSQRQRQITGTVTYFSQFDLRIAAGNGYGAAYGNGNGRKHRRHRDNDNDNGQNGNGRHGNGQNDNGRYGNGQNDNGQYGNGRNNNGQYGNGQYGNGQYGNGQGNRNEQRIHLHQGTVINPRGTNLQNGMQLRITGHPNNDGTFEADRIDVVNNGQNGYNRNGNGYQRP